MFEKQRKPGAKLEQREREREVGMRSQTSEKGLDLVRSNGAWVLV